jgi:hypothetical protein
VSVRAEWPCIHTRKRFSRPQLQPHLLVLFPASAAELQHGKSTWQPQTTVTERQSGVRPVLRRVVQDHHLTVPGFRTLPAAQVPGPAAHAGCGRCPAQTQEQRSLASGPRHHHVHAGCHSVAVSASFCWRHCWHPTDAQRKHSKSSR